jgi:preprotein translocase subunit YajC
MPQVLVFVLFFAGVYFVLLRPQQQRVKRQRELITAIGVGDRVVTAGGLIGRVVDLADDRLELEIADGVVVELLRLAISRRLDESESDSRFGGGGTAEDEEAEEVDEGDRGDEGETHEEYDPEASAADATAAPAPSAFPADPSVAAAPDLGVRPAGAAGALGQAARPSTAAGTGGTNEEAATPAPGQDPI